MVILPGRKETGVTAVMVVKLIAMLLWCHAAVLTVAWFRAVAQCDRRSHVGHFVSLMGELVPTSSLAVLLVFGGGALGLPSVIVALAVLFPAGIVLALDGEVGRIAGSSRGDEARRLGVTLAVAAGALLIRGGI